MTSRSRAWPSGVQYLLSRRRSPINTHPSFSVQIPLTTQAHPALLDEQRTPDAPYPHQHQALAHRHVRGRLPFCLIPLLNRMQSLMDLPPRVDHRRTSIDVAESNSLT
jgi:hypothetical protein